jgi:hypothetical protein
MAFNLVHCASCSCLYIAVGRDSCQGLEHMGFDRNLQPGKAVSGEDISLVQVPSHAHWVLFTVWVAWL